jgi:hypothetical protein
MRTVKRRRKEDEFERGEARQYADKEKMNVKVVDIPFLRT